MVGVRSLFPLLQIACGSYLMDTTVVVPTMQEALASTSGLPMNHLVQQTVPLAQPTILYLSSCLCLVVFDTWPTPARQ